MVCCLAVAIVVAAIMMWLFPVLVVGAAVFIGTQLVSGTTHGSHIVGGDDKPSTYPFRRLFMTRKQVQDAFRRVKEYELNIVPASYKIANMPQLTDDQRQYKGKSVLCEVDPEDYHTMNWLSDWFNEKCRLACKRYDEDESPLEYWEKHGDEVREQVPQASVEALNDAMYDRVTGCNNFRSGLLVGMIKYLGAKSVLDFSGGWGDRLLGMLATGVRGTVVDPNPCVHEGYAEMIREFGNGAAPTLIVSPFQTADLPDETYDLVFTSPPYFDLEIYASDAAQSVVEFPGLDDWYNGFLLASLRKSWSVLNDGGHLVVIINNIRGGTDYVMRMVADVSGFDGADYEGVLPYAEKIIKPNGSFYHKSPQPMWIWRKGAVGREGGDTPTESVTIEELADRHVDELAAITSDPNVMATVAAGGTWSRGRIEKLIEYAHDDGEARDRKYFHWCIMSGGRVVGYIGLYPITDDGAESLQVRVFVGADMQGRGIGKAALRLVVAEHERLFPDAVLYMQMVPANVASARLAETTGFVERPGSFSIGGTAVRRFALTHT
jgi:RimJ/RimL family protein N-acetyltransferase